MSQTTKSLNIILMWQALESSKDLSSTSRMDAFYQGLHHGDNLLLIRPD